MNRATTSDGAELCWWIRGIGEPLVLIAGQAVTHHAWDAVVDRFADHFQVVTFDHRGIAGSTIGSAPELSTRSLATDVLAVLDAVGWGRAHVFGHSLGGRVSQWLAIDHPGRVDRIVLGATTGGDGPGGLRAPETTAALLSGDPARVAPLFVDDQYAAAHPQETTALFTTAGDRRTLGRYFRASRDHHAWSELHRVAAPTLVQHGLDDRVTLPTNAELLAQAIPGAELQLYAGLRHGYYLEAAEPIDAVVRFLGRDAKASPRTR